MIDAMGGAQSAEFIRFQNLCITAFTILRKSANLILNLMTLMADASIPDIKSRGVHEQLQSKFGLDLTEEEAIKQFESLLTGSSAYHNFLDKIHGIAQYWRS